MKTKLQLLLFFTALSLLINAQVSPVLFNDNVNNNDIYPASIAYYNDEIIIPDLDNDRILKTSAVMPNATVSILLEDTKYVTGIKVIGSDLYFFQAISTNNPTTNTGKLSKINLNDANPTVVDIMTGLNIPLSMDGDANHIYFTEIIGTFIDNDFDNFD